MVIWSGPAAATRPFRDAMLRSFEVGAGRGSQAVVRRTFASLAIARNPRRCRLCQLQMDMPGLDCVAQELAYLCCDGPKLRT